MDQTRKQLTLFIQSPNETIENIRAKYNPEQFNLIAAHITLCRDDEMEDIDEIIENIKSINLKKPIRIELNRVKRFANGKGVFIPATENNFEFRELRKIILGRNSLIKEQFPHVTLMHPRNSQCTDDIFSEIEKEKIPKELFFNKISLIEQKNGGEWNVINEYFIVNNS